VGTSVRKALPILSAHLASLAKQEAPPRTRLHFCYVADWPEPNVAEQFLIDWVKERNGEVLIPQQRAPSDDFSDAPGLDSHQWQPSSMARVGQAKNAILQRALQLKADYVFLCDADLILDTTCLASLLACDKPIATAVYWTRWSRGGTELRKVHASPQVWLRHPYQLDGRGMDEAEFRSKLTHRGLVRVWGFGACTLIKRAVIEAGVDFSYVPGAPMEGLWAGEDRHFCLKAELRHIDAYADCWPDVAHIYHAQDDVPKIPQWVERLSQTHPTHAGRGDLVSIRLRALEPIPVGPGRFQQMQPQLVRGRLGQIPVAPEIEEALYTLKRGDKQIIRCHFPITHPLPYLRNRVRLIELSLIDCKSYSQPPILEEELYVGPRSGAVLDRTHLSDEQHESLAEVVNG
jgi:hypothetical protein